MYNRFTLWLSNKKKCSVRHLYTIKYVYIKSLVNFGNEFQWHFQNLFFFYFMYEIQIRADSFSCRKSPHSTHMKQKNNVQMTRILRCNSLWRMMTWEKENWHILLSAQNGNWNWLWIAKRMLLLELVWMITIHTLAYNVTSLIHF